MERATAANIMRCTDLAPVVVMESIRALIQLGVVAETKSAYRLTLYWYQDVRQLLEQQNLIVRGTP
jgi:predicted transcriptional regulator